MANVDNNVREPGILSPESPQRVEVKSSGKNRMTIRSALDEANQLPMLKRELAGIVMVTVREGSKGKRSSLLTS